MKIPASATNRGRKRFHLGACLRNPGRPSIQELSGHSATRSNPLLSVALILLLASIFTSEVRAAGCAPVVANLVGWWSGDGNANDLVGTNHGALLDGATASGVGFVGAAFNFDGTNSYVQVA